MQGWQTELHLHLLQLADLANLMQPWVFELKDAGQIMVSYKNSPGMVPISLTELKYKYCQAMSFFLHSWLGFFFYLLNQPPHTSMHAPPTSLSGSSPLANILQITDDITALMSWLTYIPQSSYTYVFWPLVSGLYLSPHNRWCTSKFCSNYNIKIRINCKSCHVTHVLLSPR